LLAKKYCSFAYGAAAATIRARLVWRASAQAIVQGHCLKGASFQRDHVGAALSGNGQHHFGQSRPGAFDLRATKVPGDLSKSLIECFAHRPERVMTAGCSVNQSRRFHPTLLIPRPQRYAYEITTQSVAVMFITVAANKISTLLYKEALGESL